MERTLIPRTAPLLSLALLLASAGPVAAHAELVSTSPAGGAELDAPPAEVVVTFDDELDPTTSRFVVTDEDGDEVGVGEVDLTVPERNVLRGVVAGEGPGEYTVAWTVTAADGHTEEGTFSFTVTASTDPPPDTPDTAVARHREARTGLVALGLALLAAATCLTCRRALPDAGGSRP